MRVETDRRRERLRAPSGRLATVDSHTCGQPTRVIVEGLPPRAGETMTSAM